MMILTQALIIDFTIAFLKPVISSSLSTPRDEEVSSIEVRVLGCPAFGLDLDAFKLSKCIKISSFKTLPSLPVPSMS